MITPREMLRDYMTVLNVLMQNPEATFEDVVKTTPVGANHDSPANMTTPVGASISAQPKSDSPATTDSPRKYNPDDIDF